MNFTLQAGQIGQVERNVAIALPNRDHRTNHTMLLADCSGSMSASIADVRNDLQRYVNGLDDGDFVSIIIFSGHNRARLIAGPTACNRSGKELLNRAIQADVRILDTTVFSEPLELAIDTAQKLSGTDTVHNAILFTDGSAVPTRWSVTIEHNKALDAARSLRRMGVIVSVIGYGVYYDVDFITDLMQAAGNDGVFRHISEIEEFGGVIEHVRDTFARTVIASLNLSFTPDNGRVGLVYKTTPQLSVGHQAGRISMLGLYEGEATLFMELSSACRTITVTGTVNGTPVNEMLTATPLTNDSVADFVRVLGASAFLQGDLATAAQLLGLTQDHGLADMVATAYSQRERRQVGDSLSRVFVDRKFIGAGLAPSGPSHCALNVLRVLIEDQQNVVFIPSGAYKRSGELMSDPRVIESPHGRTLRVLGYTSHKDRFNFSIKALKDVQVLPEYGGSPIDMKIWRTYNIILDGNLHLPELEATLSQKSFNALLDAGVIEAGSSYSPNKVYTINLRNVKLISTNWANPSTLGLVPLMREEQELEAEQKALNACTKALPAPTASADEDEGIYNPSSVKVDGIPVETYSARSVEYRLLGYKAQSYDCSTMTWERADARVKEVRQRLTVVRYLIRSIVFAMELVGSKSIQWEDGKVISRGKYDKLEQNATYLGAKLKRVTWEQQLVCS